MRPHLTAEQRQLALRLKARGLSLREIGPQVGCSHQAVALIAQRAPRRPVRQDRWMTGPGRLALADREEISLGLYAGESFTRDRCPAGEGSLDGVPGGRRQRRAESIPGVAGPRAGPAAQALQAGPSRPS